MSKKNYKRRSLKPRGFGLGRPEPTPDNARVPAGEFEVVTYDKDSGLKLLVTTREDLHPGELVEVFAQAGEEAGLDPETLQGTAKAIDGGWVISWVPPGQGEQELQKKLGMDWEPVLGGAK